jgi:hypothetical protein
VGDNLAGIAPATGGAIVDANAEAALKPGLGFDHSGFLLEHEASARRKPN